MPRMQSPASAALFANAFIFGCGCGSSATGAVICELICDMSSHRQRSVVVVLENSQDGSKLQSDV